MADERKQSKKWSLEEIDALLQDSGVMPKEEVSQEESIPTKKAEAINPRPTHNEDIKHKILSPEIERGEGTGEPQVYGAFVSEKYRDRFLNRPVQNIEKTAEHKIISEEDMQYERSGFVKRKSDFSGTSELSPVPNLVPDDRLEYSEDSLLEKTMVFSDAPKAEEDEKLQKAKTRTIGLRSLAVTDGNAHDTELPEEEDDSQLTFEGFHTPEEKNTVDEREVEEELNKKRKEKAESFTITGEMGKEEEPIKKYGTDEYRTPDDKFKVAYYLRKNKNSAFVSAIISYVCFAFAIAVSLMVKSFPEAEKLLLIFSLIVLVVCGGANYSALADGVLSFKGVRFNRNTGSLIAFIAAVIQNIAFLFASESPFEGGLNLITAIAILPLAFNKTADYFEFKRIGDNFSYITEKELYSIGKITKTETAFEIGRGLLLDEPVVLSSQKTLFPRNFIELSRRFYPSDEINKKLVPIGVAASLLISAITLLITKNILCAVTSFSAAVSISIPYFSYLADSFTISKISEKLLRKGAVLSGWEANKECVNSNAVAVDSADVFDSEGGNVFGIHPFYDIQIDEAILYTASLLIKSGGPLGNLFKRVIVGETSLLPPVDSLTYEDKLGLSAWIFNRRILVGNADLLKNHNVYIPDVALVERHLCAGRYPLYLAIDGKAAAVFIVSYDINQENAKLLRNIEKNSISLLVRADDANITDELVSGKLNLPQSGVKVLSAVSGDIYKGYCNGITSTADALLMHDGKANSFLEAISSALSLGVTKHILNIFQICAMGIGLAIVGALSFVSGFETLGSLQLSIIQCFFAAFAVFAMTGSSAAKNKAIKKADFNKIKISKNKTNKKL